MNNIHYYKPSGKFSSIIYIYLLLFLLVILPLLSIGYAYSTAYIPFRIINIAVFAIAVLILNILPYLFLENAKVRNNTISVIFYSIIFIWFYYLQWSAWFYYILQDIGIDVMTLPQVSNTILPSVFELSLHPSLMWKYGTEIISFWSGITWAIELLVLGWLLSILEGMMNNPFSELSNQWHDDKEINVELINKDKLIKAISNLDYEWLKEIKKNIIVGSDSYSKLTVYTSPTFDNYLSLEHYEVIIDTNGKSDFNDKKLINNISITKEITDILLNLTKVKNVKEIDIIEDKQKVITNKKKPIINVNSEIITTKNIITTPEIRIYANEEKSTRRALGNFVILIIGVGLLTLGIWSDSTEALIFGGLLILTSLFSLMSKALKEDDDSRTKGDIKKIAFKLNPTFLLVNSFVIPIIFQNDIFFSYISA